MMHIARSPRPWLALAFAMLLPSLLAACGFKPMYAENTRRDSPEAVGEIISGISVNANALDLNYRRQAQQFKIALEDRLNPDGAALRAPDYRLDASITLQEMPVSISLDGTISRYNVVVDASLVLVRNADGKVVYKGTARRISSYNNETNAFYSAYVSGQDAREQAVLALAEDVRLRLAAFFAQNPNPIDIEEKQRLLKEKEERESEE